jgi:putative transposase
MRHSQCTLRASEVHAWARQLLLAELSLRDYKTSLPAALLAKLLLVAACWQASLSCVCAFVPHAPSHETVRKALKAALPPRPRDLRERLRALLRQSLPGHLGDVPRVMALDLHQRPYYGRATRGMTRRKRKAGTRRSFTFATLAVLDRCGRFTCGLLLTRPYMRLTTILEELFAQARQAGLSASRVLLDKEFYSAEVIAWLQQRDLPFLMPAQRKGSQPDCGNHRFFAKETAVGFYEYTWTTRPRRRDFRTGKRYLSGALTVRVTLCVGRHWRSGKPLVYASWGLVGWSPAQVVQEYRRRFGIEVSYRQLGQCLAATSSRDERVRLLLAGVALLLGNLWAWLHSEALGTGPRGAQERRLARLRLTVLVRVLLLLSVAGQAPDPVWTTQRPLPQPDKHAIGP